MLCFIINNFDTLCLNHISLQELSMYGEDVVTGEEAEFDHVRVDY